MTMPVLVRRSCDEAERAVGIKKRVGSLDHGDLVHEIHLLIWRADGAHMLNSHVEVVLLPELAFLQVVMGPDITNASVTIKG